MTNDSQVDKLTFNAEKEGKDYALIDSSVYYTKWNNMNSSELDTEYNILLSRLGIIDDDKISQQLYEVMDLLIEYRKR